MVAASQPYLTMKFVMDYVTKGHLSCETESNGSCKSVADDMCTYMNNCNDNGSCNIDGKCECNKGSYGPDCSATANSLSTAGKAYSVTGKRWSYFLLPATGDYSVRIEATRNVSVYLRKGLTDLPDSVNFDAVIKKEKSIELT